MRGALLIVGGGFTGVALAKRARQAGIEVTVTARNDARADALRGLGLHVVLVPDAGAEGALDPWLDSATRAVATFPPDGHTDRRLAPRLAGACALAYVSSTGVFGAAQGRVDERTPVDREAPRAALRLDAEQAWLAAGATILRAPAIYGPGRGMHLRLARGELRMGPETGRAISRVHVEDLAAALLALVFAPRCRLRYVIGDEEPAPQADVVRWICGRMQIPVPDIEHDLVVDETLRHDRRVDPSRLREDSGWTPEFRTYREGFAQCLDRDGSAIVAALAVRGVLRAGLTLTR